MQVGEQVQDGRPADQRDVELAWSQLVAAVDGELSERGDGGVEVVREGHDWVLSAAPQDQGGGGDPGELVDRGGLADRGLQPGEGCGQEDVRLGGLSGVGGG